MKGIESLRPDSPVTALPGVSEKRAEAFAKAGIEKICDLVRFYPRTYEFRGKIKPLADAENGEVASFLVKITSEPKMFHFRGGQMSVICNASDDSASCTVVFFRMPYMKKALTCGAEYRMYGRVRVKNGKITVYCPKCELSVNGIGADGLPLASIVPIYRELGGMPQKLIHRLCVTATEICYPKDRQEEDVLPAEIRERFALSSDGYAIRGLHSPENENVLGAARKRIMFEELFFFALHVSVSQKARRKERAVPMCADLNPFLAALPYPLTAAQNRAISDFAADLSGEEYPMYRILSGDVGSGKTVCAAAAIYICCKSGHQACLLAPTEILARQHYEDLSSLFGLFGIHTELLVGSLKKSEKNALKKRLSDGEIDLLIGTHALLQEDVTFSDLGLAITDEQQRFGVLQRAAIERKTNGVHVLMMSATPIPRTLAMVLFGEIDRSVLDEMPPGRQKVSTFLVDESYRERLNGFIRKQAQDGKAVYIVCPSIEDDTMDPATLDEMGIKSAVSYEKILREEIFPDLGVGLVHGKMKQSAKDAVMNDFLTGKIQILVSTTVIEVGVNVPRATLMVIENADRFGLSQLHQLRGRVGRSKDKSWCILVCDDPGQAASARLKTLCETNDGAKIAQTDLALRGPGDFFSAIHEQGVYRQSGMISLGLSDPNRDTELMQDAFAASTAILAQDPELIAPEHALILSRLNAETVVG